MPPSLQIRTANRGMAWGQAGLVVKGWVLSPEAKLPLLSVSGRGRWQCVVEWGVGSTKPTDSSTQMRH